MMTHLHLDKMAAILADNNLRCIFLNEIGRTPIRISKFVARSPTDNTPALVGARPLPELMLTQFTGAYMQHYGEDEFKMESS